MAKIIRLTESDLTRIVKRAIKEHFNYGGEPEQSSQDFEDDDEFDAFASHPMAGSNYFNKQDVAHKGNLDFDEGKVFGPEDYDSFMEYINGCNTKWCLTTKRMYDSYASKGPISVVKKFRK